MEGPSEGNEVVVQSSLEDGERADEGMMARAPESPETSSPSDGAVTQTSAEPQEARPSLDEVWESIKAKDGSQAQEAQLDAKGGLSGTSPDVKHVSEIKDRVRPSSLRTRPSTRAKRNVTFKDEFDTVAEEDKAHLRPGMKRPAARGRRQQPHKIQVPPACLGLFLAVALASLVVYFASPNIPTKPQMWTSEELEKYNGTDNKPPLLLGILGSVFDVTKGWKHYGPGGSYHHFVGRDASRAFVSGNFTGDGLTDSLEGLTPSQIKAIDDWRLFFLSRYVYLGKLVGTFYNKEGLPTKKLHQAEREIKKAAKIEKQQKLDEERFPNCNSRWTQDKGGEVWCNDGKYPRIVELVTEGPRRGPPRTRCACLEQEELQRRGLTGYEGCDPLSSRCTT